MGQVEDAKVKALQEKIRTDPAKMVAVLRVIWAQQKPEEQFTGKHMGHDGRGFNVEDTEFCNQLHDELEAVGFKWQELKSGLTIRGQRVVPKYARQYRTVMRENREREAEKSRLFIDQMMAEKKRKSDAAARKRWGDAAVVS